MMANQDQAAIEQTLNNYFEALNNADVQASVAAYTTDGVFVPAGDPTTTGTQELVTAYENIFKAIRLDIRVSFDEVLIKDDLAFVRTHSAGTTLIKASGQTVPAENREFFVLRKEYGDWRIARYMFNQPK